MKIWYQVYNVSASVDPEWRYVEEACERYVPKVARSDTEIRFSWVEKRAPKMTISKYSKHQRESSAALYAPGYFEAFSLCGKSRDVGNRVLKLSVGACRARDS